ncbi:MAG: polyhydroxyalkanoic acid system family protein [Pirellulales bacterium]
MKIKKKHNRTQAEAKQRLIGLANTMGMVLEWVDEQSATGSMAYNGVVVSGAAQVTDSEVILDVELPRLARMFSSRIQKQVEKEMDKAL